MCESDGGWVPAVPARPTLLAACASPTLLCPTPDSQVNQKGLESGPSSLQLLGLQQRYSVIFSFYLQVYQKGLESDPSNLQLLSSLAQFHASRRDYVAAAQAWQAVLQRDPHNGWALYALGLQHQQDGEMAAARAAFKRGLSCRGAAGCGAVVRCSWPDGWVGLRVDMLVYVEVCFGW
jgi:tetratricopeptide (TPR) repeat protein